MAKLINYKDSTNKHLNYANRHIRLCRQVPGADKYVTVIQPYVDELTLKHTETLEKKMLRNAAYDDMVLADMLLDNAVRTSFEKCKQYDRENPGNSVLLQIFPEGTYGDIIKMPMTKEPNEVEKTAVHFENLGESHTLYGQASVLRELINAVNNAVNAYNESIRQLKISEAEEEISKETVRRQYEVNYLDARKELGRVNAEMIFPKFSRQTVQTGEPEETVVNGN